MSGDALFTRIRSEADLVTPRQRRVMTLLEERARRTELLAGLAPARGARAGRPAHGARAGPGSPPHPRANVLRAERGEPETSARGVSRDGLVAMARATRRVVELLGGC